MKEFAASAVFDELQFKRVRLVATDGSVVVGDLNGVGQNTAGRGPHVTLGHVVVKKPGKCFRVHECDPDSLKPQYRHKADSYRTASVYVADLTQAFLLPEPPHNPFLK